MICFGFASTNHITRSYIDSFGYFPDWCLETLWCRDCAIRWIISKDPLSSTDITYCTVTLLTVYNTNATCWTSNTGITSFMTFHTKYTTLLKTGSLDNAIDMLKEYPSPSQSFPVLLPKCRIGCPSSLQKFHWRRSSHVASYFSRVKIWPWETDWSVRKTFLTRAAIG